MLPAQTYGYVLYVVTEGVTYNKQHYFKLSYDFFDSQNSLSVLQSQTSHTKCEFVLYSLPVETICTWSLTLAGTCACMRVWLVMQRHASSLALTSILKQPLNSGHPAILRITHSFRGPNCTQAIATQRPRFSGHWSTFSARLSTIAAVVNNLTLD